MDSVQLLHQLCHQVESHCPLIIFIIYFCHFAVIGPVVISTLGGIFILIIIIVIISFVICWYKRIGICAKLHKRRRPRTTDRDENDELESHSLLLNSEPMDTTSNTLPSTTVSTTPPYTGNTLPNMVVPQASPNPHVQYTTLPAHGGHNPPPYYYLPPINGAFRNHQRASHLPPPYSEVAYLPRQQIYPSAHMVPGQTPPQQYMTPQQSLCVQQPQQMSLQSNRSTTTQNIELQVPQEPVTIQDTATQNPPSQNESSTPVNGNSTTPIPSEHDTSIVDVSSTSNLTPQIPATIVSPITTTTPNNSHIEAHGAGASTEETYEVVDGSVVDNDNVYESEGDPPSYSDLYDDTA